MDWLSGRWEQVKTDTAVVQLWSVCLLFFAECLDNETSIRGRQRRAVEGGGDGETDPNSGLGKKEEGESGVSPWV